MEEGLHLNQPVSHKYNEQWELLQGGVLPMGGVVQAR